MRSKDASGTAVPMCGVPFHAADGYIARLVRKGYRVAICEQIEDPKKAKGVVKREVGRMSDRLAHLIARTVLESATARRLVFQLLAR